MHNQGVEAENVIKLTKNAESIELGEIQNLIRLKIII
jgi:hypothetical protein